MTTWLATQPSVHQTRQSGTTGQQGLGAPGEAKSSSKFHSAFLTRTLSLAADGITQGPSEEAIPQGVKQPVVSSCGCEAACRELPWPRAVSDSVAQAVALPAPSVHSFSQFSCFHRQETVRQDTGDGAGADPGPALSSGTPATVTTLLGLRMSLDGCLREERGTIPSENHGPGKKRTGLGGEGEAAGIGHPAMSLWDPT